MAAKTKPSRPDGCPLFAHRNGQWAKKVKGKFRYFGPWSDLEGALTKYKAETTPDTYARVPSKASSVPAKTRPAKPHPDFPLYPHSSGQWARKVRGKTCYFGAWSDPDGALKKYLDQKDDLLAGREVRNGDGLVVYELVNHFLTSKKRKVKSGELTERAWQDYDRICGAVIDVFGRTRPVLSLTPTDFEVLRETFAKSHGTHALKKDVTCTRSLFKYGCDADLVDRPVKFGPSFKPPSRLTMRKEKQKKGPLMYTPAEVQSLLGAASLQLRAMILLGVNCGFGNHDCAMLPLSAIEGEWVTFPRPKTGIDRRCHLWPETVEALQKVIHQRKIPKDPVHADRVFITTHREPWTPKTETGDSPVSKEMAKLIKTLGLQKRGRNFYTLRRVFETVAGDTGDQVAVDQVMGHAPAANDMGAIYRQRISDDRLIRVADEVRRWLNRTPSHRDQDSVDVE